MAAKKITIPPSDSGYFAVSITRRFPHQGFDYMPGTAITVDRPTLGAMMAEEGLLADVVAAD